MKAYFIFTIIVSILLFVLPQLVYVVLRLVMRLFHVHLPWSPFVWTGVVLMCLWLAAYCYGHFVGRFLYEVKPFEYATPQVPKAFEGYRIVHISDLHLGGWDGHTKKLKRVVDCINELQPDLVVFTGDLVSFDYREALPYTDILSSLRATDGVVSILGNHDYDPYARGLSDKERVEMLENLIDYERDTLGWRLLLNEHYVVHRGTDSLAILGVENQSRASFRAIQRAKLKEAMEGTEGMFRILLTHDPTHWRDEVVGGTDIPLTLCGHTHALQMRVLGFTPCRWIYPECDGRYDEGEQTLYVNIGLGGTLPMRIGATPEITLTTLSSK